MFVFTVGTAGSQIFSCITIFNGVNFLLEINSFLMR